MQPVDRHDAESEVVDRENGGIEAGHTGALILLVAAAASAPLAFRHFGFRGFVIAYAVALLSFSFSVWRRRPGGVLVLAIALRLLFFAFDPQLSGDVYRYLWDGKVLFSGRNPYALPPNAPELAPLDPRINHPEIPTIYPPHAQLLFAIARPLIVWRLLLLLADVAIIRLLKGHAALAYALFPLAIFENAWSAHIEAIAALLLLIALQRGSGAAAGAAVGVKLIPIAAIPALFQLRARWLATFTLALLAPALPFLLAGPIMPGMRDYATRWIFNSPLFSAVFFVIDRLHIAEHLKSLWTAIKDPLRLEFISPFVYEHLYADFLTRAILGITAATAIVILVRRKAPVAHSVGALLLCSPAIHPWYWIVLVPLALHERTKLWIALALCAPFSYLLYEGFSPWLVFTLCYALPLVIARFRPSAIAT